MTPSWMAALLAMQDRESASIALGGAFLAAPPAERTAVRAGWPFGAEWPWPSQWRLACTRGERGTPHERIVASLVLMVLEAPLDEREGVLMLAVVYHGSLLAGLDPDAIFSMVAAAAPAPAAAALKAFVARSAPDKAMAAFALEVRTNADGEQELHADW